MHRLATLLLFGLLPLLISCAENHAESVPEESSATMTAASSASENPSSTDHTGSQGSGPGRHSNDGNHPIATRDSDRPSDANSDIERFDSVISGSSSPFASAQPTAGERGAAHPSPASPPAPRRLAPLTRHNGVNHAHVHSRGIGYGSDASERQHRWIASIGGNAIAITPFGFQRGARSDELVGFGPDDVPGTRDRSMNRDDMAAEIAAAHRNGLRVMVKPHIWSNDFWNGGEWHGTIEQNTPEEHRRWWASYRTMILYYARFAEENKADYFCVGTELVKMTTTYPGEWRGLIADVRNVFKGGITYAAHWDREWRAISFWDALDYIGIASYFPLNAPDSASVEQLVQLWQPYRTAIDSVARSFDRNVLFLEFGYRPVAGTWREPWLYEGGTPDPEAQRKGFEAMFRAFRNDPWFRGIYVWKSFTDDAAARRSGEQTGFVFKGLPGERVLKSWWLKE